MSVSSSASQALPGFDPQAADIEPHIEEPALPEQALSFSHLQQVFARIQSQPDFPQWTPELLRDRRRPLVPVTRETATRASVLIPLVPSFDASDEIRVVLTQRTPDLSAHAGQVSFPGGRAESHDESPNSTALREAHEEIGLHPDRVTVWGQMPDYLTATGFLVTPVIGHVASPADFLKDPREVAHIFQVPLSFLMDPANHQRRVVGPEKSPTGEAIRFFAMPYQEFFIWGATAAILRNLYRLLWAAWDQR